MRAILARPSGGFALAEVEPPAIGPGEILLEMRACGLCGTDIAKLGRPEGACEARLGHEVAGVVRAVGPGVARFAPGDRVTAAHHVPCGSCGACQHGNESMCLQFKRTHIDPCGFAELIRIPRLQVERVALRLPHDMSFEVAAFTEPLACAVRAVERSQVLPGDRIAVLGGGGMGLLIAQALLLRGAEPIVVDIAETRLALARALGVKATVNPTREDVPEALAALTQGSGLDGAVLTVTNGRILTDIQYALRAGGRINVFAGPSDGPVMGVDLADLYHREIALFSTYSSTPVTFARAFDLLARDEVRVIPLISHRLPLAAFEEGVALQRGGAATKVIFHP
jgi:L-iditol 2-dehydrogenase